MVMEFKARDAALLKGLKDGDSVEFDLVKMGKEYQITRIAPTR
jgi:Cu/Ag efflux protein CusF